MSSSNICLRCNDRCVAAVSTVTGLSLAMLSSESLGPDKEARLLRSVRDGQWERVVFLRDRVTALTLARLTLALWTAETNPKEDPDDDFR